MTCTPPPRSVCLTRHSTNSLVPFVHVVDLKAVSIENVDKVEMNTNVKQIGKEQV